MSFWLGLMIIGLTIIVLGNAEGIYLVLLPFLILAMVTILAEDFDATTHDEIIKKLDEIIEKIGDSK